MINNDSEKEFNLILSINEAYKRWGYAADPNYLPKKKPIKHTMGTAKKKKQQKLFTHQ